MKNKVIVVGIVKVLCMDRGFCSILIHLLVGPSLNIGALVSDSDSVNVDLSSVILSGATVLMILQHFVNVFVCT
ncbi:hypothetical protein OIU79_019074, partial [Salix purpurea]